MLAAATLLSQTGPGHARRRGGGGHESKDFTLLDPYIPYIVYGIGGFIVLLVLWVLWRRFSQGPSERTSFAKDAKRRADQLHARRR
ncbi:MAG: hypothetical protein EOO27_09435 [Comamonadaceae bacterium]|nr:MAG: hypothetical protein EOO27_09435 [Comamonadaceae bacterium]